MKNFKFTISLFVFGVLAYMLPNKVAAQITAKEIIKKTIEIPNGDNRKTFMNITLTNKNNRTRKRKTVSYSKDIGKDKKTLIFTLEPADVKGTAFLSWEYDSRKKEDDNWLYLPAMKKTRRISGSTSKSGSFMGTDFTYDDMGGRNIDEDNYKILKEEKLQGFDCWVIESVPVNSKEIYSKKISWIRKDNFIAIKVDFYNRMQIHFKTLAVSNIEKINGFWTAKKMEMKNLQRNHKTIIEIAEIEYNIDINNNYFTVPTLENGI